ncbi:hypothetical protein PQ469_31045 [Mucilaginibacter sp. KACC 22773]|uniref:hypothetical protein n=1 Tax=Mucilaginibacter sp. KACC 22773 TaxID=3025671 RepID=UPI0023669AEA|nr:hypothetical protein [Mucilaginibacter sp. KACC 22773]WDF78327.1 hypothetical protein PQ469_31045 [Mucilaginibacter sp. KACC 22773]
METYLIKKTRKIKVRSKMLMALVFTIITIACCLNQVIAQSRTNQSDWNVPPPVPPPLHPGTQVKGGTNGKPPLDKPVALSLSDIPPVSLPPAPPVQMPVLAAVSTVSPVVNTPDQPTILGIGANLPEIPMPGAPETPGLPKQSLRDLPVTSIPELPIPASPELPTLPAEPIPSGQPVPANISMPAMPEVLTPAMPNPPANGGGLEPWPSPGIPENANFKLITATVKEGRTGSIKGAKKVKSKSVKK